MRKEDIMRNKSGQIFMLWVVILTLLLCISSVGVYLYQRSDLENSLVSPRAVLDVQDRLEIFELREVELIKESLKGLNKSDFGSSDFLVKFRSAYVGGFLKNENMKDFIFENLYLDGEDRGDKSRLTGKSFVRNKLYPLSGTEVIDGKIYFSREKMGKRYYLKGNQDSKNNFPVNFYFEYGRVYLISLEDGEYEVGEAFV